MFLNKGEILLNRYEIIDSLGTGGMGTAHLVHDQNLDRRCVIKEMLKLTEATQDQFEREAQLLASLHHPNLPEVYHYFRHQERPFLVMELVPGQNLEQLQSQSPDPFAVTDVLQWAYGLLEALCYIHEHNPPVIHRDIKPKNVCITPQSKAVLLDFGIARRLDETQTVSGAQALSHDYAPIEQYRRPQVLNISTVHRYLEALREQKIHTGPYSDIYSLGATLYFALAGYPPPNAGMRILRDELRPLRKINPQVPAWLSDTVMHALRLHPRERFQSAAEMLEVLRPPTGSLPPLPNYTPLSDTPSPNAASSTNEASSPSHLEEKLVHALPSPLRQRGRLWSVVAGVVSLVALVAVVALILFTSGNENSSRPTDRTRIVLGLAAGNMESPIVPSAPTHTASQTILPATATLTSVSTDTPIPTPTFTTAPTAAPPSATSFPTPRTLDFTVNTNQLIVHAAPGTDYEVLNLVQRGDRLLATGRLADGSWWQVDFFGLQGWVPAQPTVLVQDARSLPVITPPSLPTVVSPTPSPLPPMATPACAIASAGAFEPVWQESSIRARLGCPTEPIHRTTSAYAQFEHGFMYWREDRRLIYVLYDDGRWQEFVDTWMEGSSPNAQMTPPPALLEPARGFGKVWREQLGGPEAAIGWAIEEEQGLETTVGDFDAGVILQLHSSIFLLYGDTMTWQRYVPGMDNRTASDAPDGRIVFASDREGNSDIYIMQADGSNQRRLTDDPAEDELPSTSPDGRWIAFQSERDGNWEVYVMQLDGSGLQRVTDHPDADQLPNWSPDSRRLVFRSDRGGDFELYTIRLDGTGLQQLTNDEHYDGHASWSQDNLIAYNSGQEDATTWEIVVISTDGSDRRQLTHNDVNDWSPNWSPDGQAIIFLSRRGGDPAIYLMDADGGNPRLLYNTPDYEWGAVFSPDGQWVAFTSDQSGDYEVYVIKSDGSNLIRLTRQGGWYPSWVP